MVDATAPASRPLGNTDARYGAVTKAFHWTVALGILAMIPLGIVANDLPHDDADALARKALLFSIHKTLGLTILLVAVARIAWALSQPKPGALHPERRLETLLADTTHFLLYASLILVPSAGWVAHAASEGFAPIWWPLGQSLPFVPKSEAVYRTASALHIVFERLLVLTLLLHVAGALKHHLWDRDATLRRMTPGQPDLPPVRPHRRSLAPPAVAAAVIALAIGVGASLGLYAPEARATQTATLPPLDAVPTGWSVEDGALTIAVTQLGSRVEGEFADWTAAVAFDEVPDAEGRHGDVEVTVAIASLTVGSVTAQALGADFFAADEFPRAVFAADILPAPEGSEADYVADGTLTLRGAEVPVTLPFDLTLEGDRAVVEGVTTVDRLAFGIGETYADPGTLAFEVEIAVALEAVRTE